MISKDEKKFLEETRDDLKRILRRIECTLAVDATSNYDAMEDQSKSEEYEGLLRKAGIGFLR